MCVFFYDDGDTSTTLLVLKWKDIKLGHEISARKGNGPDLVGFNVILRLSFFFLFF